MYNDVNFEVKPLVLVSSFVIPKRSFNDSCMARVPLFKSVSDRITNVALTTLHSFNIMSTLIMVLITDLVRL